LRRLLTAERLGSSAAATETAADLARGTRATEFVLIVDSLFEQHSSVLVCGQVGHDDFRMLLTKTILSPR
jgi:hypothetical protein